MGKKDPDEDMKLTLKDRVNLIKKDLNAGADHVLIEARESGKNIGIFDKNGNRAKDDIIFVFREAL